MPLQAHYLVLSVAVLKTPDHIEATYTIDRPVPEALMAFTYGPSFTITPKYVTRNNIQRLCGFYYNAPDLDYEEPIAGSNGTSFSFAWFFGGPPPDFWILPEIRDHASGAISHGLPLHIDTPTWQWPPP